MHRHLPRKLPGICALISLGGVTVSCGSQKPSFTQTTVRAQEIFEPTNGSESDRMGSAPSADATVAVGDYGAGTETPQQPQNSGRQASSSIDGSLVTSEISDGNGSTLEDPVVQPGSTPSRTDSTSSNTSESETASGSTPQTAENPNMDREPTHSAETPPNETESGSGGTTTSGSTSGGLPQEPTLPSDNITEETVASMCQTQVKKSKTVTLTFAEKPAGCAWSSAGNLNPVDGIIRARHEDVIPLQLGESETICELSVKSQAQSISFDDSLLITFNGIILMSSYDYTSEFSSQEGLFSYSWPNLLNAYNPGPFDDDTTYCLGAGEGDGASCEVPETQTLGTFALTLPKARSHQLSAIAKAEKKADLSVIVTGDDNADDCQRSELQLQVELSYIGGSN